MRVLGIETSCDETALALIDIESHEGKISYKILGSYIHSQIAVHSPYGGVYPALAKREHARNLIPLLEKAFSDTNTVMHPTDKTDIEIATILENTLSPKEAELHKSLSHSDLRLYIPNIDLIAITKGPGLEPALWVGLNFAQALSALWNIPAVPVNHMEGHVIGSILHSIEPNITHTATHIEFPALSLLVSGGHTEIVLIEDWGAYTVIGSTRDDAVGEAFDKVARMLGLPYPGGPQISQYAENARNNPSNVHISLPRPMIHSKDFDFSFSGIKTAVLYTLRDTYNINSPEQAQKELPDEVRDALCKEFEDAVTEVLVSKLKSAYSAYSPTCLLIGGGVSANTHLRKALYSLGAELNIPVYIPHHHVTGDNALMIAVAGYMSSQTYTAEIRVQTHIGAHTDLKAQGTMALE